MGCDIHMFVEYSVNKGSYHHDERMLEDNSDPEYTYFNDTDLISRNYKFFGFLADVRTSGSCIFEPRGMPDDPSDYVRRACEQWGVDGHSHSYLSFKELKKVIKEYRESELEECRQNKEESEWVKTAYQDVIDYIQQGIDSRSNKCPEGLFDFKVEARIVFWFDN